MKHASKVVCCSTAKGEGAQTSEIVLKKELREYIGVAPPVRDAL